jgi:transposase InsO family protein
VTAVRCDFLPAGVEIPMARLCRTLGVARSTAYHQPKVERLHRPVDEALARAEVARSIPHDNHERPHQSLNDRTPQQAFLNPNPAA